MTTVLFVLAIVAALAVVGGRRWRRAHLRRQAARRPGASAENPIYIRSYAEMDDHLARRWCLCGGYLERTGEGTREVAGHRFRIARLRCQECDAIEEVFFDTTEMPH